MNEVGSGLMIQDTLQGVPVNVSAQLIMTLLFGFGPNNYYRYAAVSTFNALALLMAMCLQGRPSVVRLHRRIRDCPCWQRWLLVTGASLSTFIVISRISTYDGFFFRHTLWSVHLGIRHTLFVGRYTYTHLGKNGEGLDECP